MYRLVIYYANFNAYYTRINGNCQSHRDQSSNLRSRCATNYYWFTTCDGNVNGPVLVIVYVVKLQIIHYIAYISALSLALGEDKQFRLTHLFPIDTP